MFSAIVPSRSLNGIVLPSLDAMPQDKVNLNYEIIYVVCYTFL